VRWGKTANLSRVVRAVVFTRWQLCCPLASALFVQLLPQQSGAIQLWMRPSVPEISSRIYHLPCFGKLVCCPIPLVSICASPNCFSLRVQCWEFASLPYPPILQGRISIPPLPLLVVLDYSSLFMFFSFVGGRGRFNLTRGCTALCSRGVVSRGVTCGVWCLPVQSAVSYKQPWNWLAGRNCPTFFSAVWFREAFHGLGIQDVTQFDSAWCSVFCLLGEKKKERGKRKKE
jgi:hypothetical protein